MGANSTPIIENGSITLENVLKPFLVAEYDWLEFDPCPGYSCSITVGVKNNLLLQIKACVTYYLSRSRNYAE